MRLQRGDVLSVELLDDLLEGCQGERAGGRVVE